MNVHRYWHQEGGGLVLSGVMPSPNITPPILNNPDVVYHNRLAICNIRGMGSPKP